MQFLLHTNSSLQEIQTGFSNNFPGLKIDFEFVGDEKLNLSSQFHHSFLSIPVEELCPDCATEDIIIEETMTASEVESMFENYWHLPAKIYAKIDGYWQKNNKTKESRLKEYIHPFAKFNKADFLVFPGL